MNIRMRKKNIKDREKKLIKNKKYNYINFIISVLN